MPLMSEASLLVLIVVVLVVVMIFAGVKTVSQGMEYTVERLGKYTRTLKPGLNFLIPFLDRVSYQINMKEQVLDIDQQSVITLDNAAVMADGIVFYQVVNAAKSAYEISDLELAMRNLCLTNIRTVLGSMSLDDMLSNREVINTQLLGVVDEATDPWGIKVTRIEIKDLEPPEDLVEAMSRQMKAERQKRAEILEAEGKRQSEVLAAEGKKQAAILEAEGLKEAAFREAEGRERLAEAEAKATLLLSEAVKNGDERALNYFVAQKYIEALTVIGSAENEKLVLMPLEAASVIGAIGGISEVVKKMGSKTSGEA